MSHGKIWLIHHDDVIKWKHFPLYWPFVRGIHRSLVNSPHKDQWRGALMFLLICAWINDWVNNREAGDLRRHQTHCDVTVMILVTFNLCRWNRCRVDILFAMLTLQYCIYFLLWTYVSLLAVLHLYDATPFNPGMDKQIHPVYCVELHYLSIPILQWCNRWSVGLDK